MIQNKPAVDSPPEPRLSMGDELSAPGTSTTLPLLDRHKNAEVSCCNRDRRWRSSAEHGAAYRGKREARR